MKKESVVVVCDGDAGHFEVIRRGLFRAGVRNEMHHFTEGSETLDYLREMCGQEQGEHDSRECILILDTCIDDNNGINVLENIKGDDKLSKIPVVILTAVDDPETVRQCHDLGCSTYIVKPEQEKAFEDAVRKIGLFLSFVELALIE